MELLFLEALLQQADERTLDLCSQLDEIGEKLGNMEVPANDEEFLASLIRLEKSLKRLVPILERLHLL